MDSSTAHVSRWLAAKERMAKWLCQVWVIRVSLFRVKVMQCLGLGLARVALRYSGQRAWIVWVRCSVYGGFSLSVFVVVVRLWLLLLLRTGLRSSATSGTTTVKFPDMVTTAIFLTWRNYVQDEGAHWRHLTNRPTTTDDPWVVAMRPYVTLLWLLVCNWWQRIYVHWAHKA